MGNQMVETCNLCKCDKPFCKAHLWPKGLEPVILGRRKQTGDNLITLPIEQGREQRYQTLEFDKQILCADCDNRLGKYDRLLVEFVRHFFDHPDRQQPLESNQKTRILTIEKLDTQRLMLAFAASVLRLSYSTRTPDVRLGKIYSSKFAGWLESGLIPDSDSRLFEAILIGYAKCPFDSDRIFVPEPEGGKSDGAHFYFFHLPGLMLSIKIGRGEWMEKVGRHPKVTHHADKLEIPLFDPAKALHLSLFEQSIRNNS